MNMVCDDRTVDDDGLAGPRTALAWRRTALAGVIGSLAALRYTLACHAGGVGELVTVVLALAAVLLAVVVVAQTRTACRLGAADTRDGGYKLAMALLIVAFAASHLLVAVPGCRA